MLAEMTSRHLVEWAEYLRRHPTGPGREDLRAALVVTAVYNSALGRSGKPLRPEDVFRNLKAPRRRVRRQTPEQLLAIVTGITVALGGKVER